MMIAAAVIFFVELTGRCAAEPRSYHIAGGIPVE
jgi:hypothetical protein